jgi:hypothetical protein
MIQGISHGAIVRCLAAAISVLATGCATVPYRYGVGIEAPDTLQLRPGEPQVERGRPNSLVDGVGWVFGIPSKVLLLDRRMDNHDISRDTETALCAYLATNSLRNVKVRLNRWDPADEWGRLFRNRAVGWGWRYTFGVVEALRYTLVPGRLFSGLLAASDHFNPLTNTINLYSDHPAVALHEGAHAKDSAGRTYKGTYAFVMSLPVLALWPETLATGDAIGYLRAEKQTQREKKAYAILYPAYATYVGGAVSSFAGTDWYTVAAVVPGHIVGRIKASEVDARPSR